MTHCERTTVRFNKAAPAEKSLGKLHLNLSPAARQRPFVVSALVIIYMRCSLEGRKYIFWDANEFCVAVPHIFFFFWSVIVRVIESDGC